MVFIQEHLSIQNTCLAVTGARLAFRLAVPTSMSSKWGMLGESMTTPRRITALSNLITQHTDRVGQH